MIRANDEETRDNKGGVKNRNRVAIGGGGARRVLPRTYSRFLIEAIFVMFPGMEPSSSSYSGICLLRTCNRQMKSEIDGYKCATVAGRLSWVR